MFSVKLEVGGAMTTVVPRPADILVPKWFCSRPADLDITVISLLIKLKYYCQNRIHRGVGGGGGGGGSAAASAKVRKHSKNYLKYKELPTSKDVDAYTPAWCMGH